MNRLLLLLFVLLAGCKEGEAERNSNAFDFYVFALTWSASYCEAEGESANRQQCGAGGPSGFIVHGLWPQFEQGYPEYCATGKEERFSRHELGQLRDLFPSNGLIRHQWRKHGSCTGLSRQQYFSTVRAARQRVRVPEIFEQAESRTISPSRVEAEFRQANPGLSADAIAVTCQQGLVRDVRICLTKDLEFRSCAEVDRRACRFDRIRMPGPNRP